MPDYSIGVFELFCKVIGFREIWTEDCMCRLFDLFECLDAETTL